MKEDFPVCSLRRSTPCTYGNSREIEGFERRFSRVFAPLLNTLYLWEFKGIEGFERRFSRVFAPPLNTLYLWEFKGNINRGLLS